MRALHDLVTAGKIHYIGASSMHCWEFSRLHYTAKLHGWTAFSTMSGLYNLLYREEEREMIPFCNAHGIALLPWSPVARGLLTRPWNEKSKRSAQDVKTVKWFSGEQNEQIVNRVAQLAKQKGCTMSDIALAWLLAKGTSPILGLNSAERIEQVSRAFAVKLTKTDVTILEELYRPVEVQAI
jgi:aryl-alcohol dehydrogenase-like predicted oxidoreductase